MKTKFDKKKYMDIVIKKDIRNLVKIINQLTQSISMLNLDLKTISEVTGKSFNETSEIQDKFNSINKKLMELMQSE